MEEFIIIGKKWLYGGARVIKRLPRKLKKKRAKLFNKYELIGVNEKSWKTEALK